MGKFLQAIPAILVVMILAAIAIPAYDNYVQKAREAAGVETPLVESSAGNSSDADNDGGFSGLDMFLVVLLSGGAIGGVYWWTSIKYSNRATQMVADTGTLSVQPFLRYDPNSVWGQAMGLRDQAYDPMMISCRKLGVDAFLNKSIDFVYPAWALIEAWIPVDTAGATERVRLDIYIDPKPRSRYPFEYRIVCTMRGRKKTYGPFTPMTPDTIEAWTRYLFGKGPKLSTTDHRVRKFPWEFWYQKNKIQGVDSDPLAMAQNVAIVVTVVAGMAGITFLAVPGIAALLFCLWYRQNRRSLFINEGRPGGEPRTLRLVDSWQTMATGIGGDADTVRERLQKRLSEGTSLRINLRPENISYVTPQGKQERQQLVLAQGRGIVFVHVYRYGDDLYVGWDAHLNFGEWAEKALAQGFDKTLGNPVTLNTVTPGVAQVTEYDLIDLNSLIEWVHMRMVQITKDILAEHKLDQEIDFKIVRGERQTLLRNQESKQERPTLFKRAAAAGHTK